MPHRVLPSLSLSGGPIRRGHRHRRSLSPDDGAPLRRSTRHQPSPAAVERVHVDDDVDMPDLIARGSYRDVGLLAAASLLFGLGDALGDGESAAAAAAVPAGEF